MLERELDREKTRRDFRRVVGMYDAWSRLTEARAAKVALDLAPVRDGLDILEVACGTGVMFEKIVRKNPNGRNTGIDLSPDMLDKARIRLAGYRKSQVTLETGDALNLDFPGDTFDILFNNYMVDLMPEDTFGQIAAEFFRVLKPGGTAVVTTFSFGEKRVNRIWLWIARNFPDLLTGCRPVQFAGYLDQAGFKVRDRIQVSQNTFPSEVIRVEKPGLS